MKEFIAFCLISCLSVIPALPKDNANVVPPGNWGAVENLPQGTNISVRMTFEDRIDGKFAGLDDDSIRLFVDEKERIYPRNDVAEVWQLRVPDRKRNGTLIGMGAVAVAGIIGAVAYNATWKGEDALGLVVVLGSTDLGATVGAIVDAAIKGDKLLYRTR